VRLGHVGDDAREGGLAGTGRTPQDDRLEQVALDRFAQRPAGREDVILADDLVQCPRADPIGERRAGSRPTRRGLPGS